MHATDFISGNSNIWKKIFDNPNLQKEFDRIDTRELEGLFAPKAIAKKQEMPVAQRAKSPKVRVYHGLCCHPSGKPCSPRQRSFFQYYIYRG